MKAAKAYGYTIIELIVMLGVLTILGLITAQVIVDTSKNTKTRQMSSVRDQVAMWVRTSAGNVGQLRNSLKIASNASFHSCVCGVGTCASAQPYTDFTLYDLAQPPQPIALYYDSTGLPCNDSTAPSCYIKVTISFIAQCLPAMPSSNPTPPPTCTGQAAEFIGMMFTVGQNPPTLTQGNYLKDVKGIAFTEVADLSPVGSGICP